MEKDDFGSNEEIEMESREDINDDPASQNISIPLGYYGDVSKINLVKDQPCTFNVSMMNKLIPVTDIALSDQNEGGSFDEEQSKTEKDVSKNNDIAE